MCEFELYMYLNEWTRIVLSMYLNGWITYVFVLKWMNSICVLSNGWILIVYWFKWVSIPLTTHHPPPGLSLHHFKSHTRHSDWCHRYRHRLCLILPTNVSGEHWLWVWVCVCVLGTKGTCRKVPFERWPGHRPADQSTAEVPSQDRQSTITAKCTVFHFHLPFPSSINFPFPIHTYTHRRAYNP